MLPLEHSAIFLTCIKRQLVLKSNFCRFESGRFTPVLPYYNFLIKIGIFMSYVAYVFLLGEFALVLNQLSNSSGGGGGGEGGVLY